MPQANPETTQQKINDAAIEFWALEDLINAQGTPAQKILIQSLHGQTGIIISDAGFIVPSRPVVQSGGGSGKLTVS